MRALRSIEGEVIPAVDPVDGTVLWTWDPVHNAIVFKPLSVPEPGKTLTVTYASGCMP